MKLENRNRIKPVFILMLPVLAMLVSCIPQKRILYLQDKKDENKTEFSAPKTEYRIRPGDELFIRVISLDEKTTKIFNSMLGEHSPATLMQYGGGYINSFTVGDSGYIDFPYIGEIEVVNLTTDEIRLLVREELKDYLKYITVIVKIVNFKVTVVGEVANPGYFDIYNDEVSLFEALGMAGDLTEYGNRNKVTLIRQTENGEIVRYLDLSSKEILNSEYLYLMPNDVIYVPPMAAKAFNLRNFQLQTFLSLILSTIVLYNYLNPGN